VLNDAGKAVEFTGSESGGTPTNVSYNYMGSHNWHIYVGADSSPNINGNEITDWYAWYGNTGAFHHDGIMVFGDDGHPAVPYIYNNYIHGDLGIGEQNTAYIYCTYGSSPGHTSSCNLFNNVFVSSSEHGGGALPVIYNGGDGGPETQYNNTSITDGDSWQGFYGYQAPGTTVTSYNNIAVGVGESPIYNTSMYGYPCSAYVASDYNNYYAYGTAWCGTYTLTQWRGLGYDTHSITSNPQLGSTYRLQAGSLAIGAAKNLTTLCTGRLAPLCYDKAGVLRPTTGNWDMGAYQYASGVGTAPDPPRALTVSVR
jgi:hypothetical protein